MTVTLAQVSVNIILDSMKDKHQNSVMPSDFHEEKYNDSFKFVIDMYYILKSCFNKQTICSGLKFQYRTYMYDIWLQVSTGIEYSPPSGRRGSSAVSIGFSPRQVARRKGHLLCSHGGYCRERLEKDHTLNGDTLNCSGCGGRHLRPGRKYCTNLPVGFQRVPLLTGNMETLSEEEKKKIILGAHASAPEPGMRIMFSS